MNAAFFFEDFCAAVCERVRFKPDRGKIRDELMDHLTDRLEVLTAQGMDRDEARAAAVAAMGDPAAIGDALDRLHSPGMGWLLVWLGRAARVLLVLALLAAVRHPVRLVRDLAAPPPSLRPLEDTPFDFDVLASFRPTTIFRSGDYIFTVERAAVTPTFSTPGGYRNLWYLLRADHRNPWLRGPELPFWIAAEDDLGNHYSSFSQSRQEPLSVYTGSSNGNLSAEYPFVSYYELCVSRIPPDARSVTVFFDRYGERAFSLLIPLEGGEGA